MNKRLEQLRYDERRGVMVLPDGSLSGIEDPEQARTLLKILKPGGGEPSGRAVRRMDKRLTELIVAGSPTEYEGE